MFQILFVYLNVCNLISTDQIIIVFIQRCDEVVGLAKFYYYFMMCTYNNVIKASLLFDVCYLLCGKKRTVCRL